MQEGMVALVQMARTAAAMERHHRAGLLSVAAHRSPTTGGVFASYGSLADLRVVERDATIGFAGPRVVLQTSGEEVGERSHRAATALDAGLVDAEADDADLVRWVEAALGLRSTPLRTALASATPITGAHAATPEADADPWAMVVAARGDDRPSGIDVAARLTTTWVEIGAGTDPALRAALATTVGGREVVVVANDRHAGSGRPTPAGYRNLRRAVALAERLGRPLVTLVDTPGADPGADAENDGIAGEIARTFAAMGAADTPTVAVCVGEGGSGGALAYSVADRFLVQATAIFSVIAPEGAAAILERDAARAPDLARRLRLTSGDLVDLGVVDGIVPDAPDATVQAIDHALDDLTGPAVADVGVRRLARWDGATARWLR
jgi:acetyl-CoA carboxylase carboxyl transferase subunit beta